MYCNLRGVVVVYVQKVKKGYPLWFKSKRKQNLFSNYLQGIMLLYEFLMNRAT